MKKPTGKGKGTQFERDMSRRLSLWLSGGDRSDLLWRSSMSGGRATISMIKGEKLSAQSGDLSSIHKLSHDFIEVFYVELKFYKKLDIESLVKGTGGRLDKFWTTTRGESEKYDKLPFLIAKQNFSAPFLCLDPKGLKCFGIGDIQNYPVSLLAVIPRTSMYLFDMESFLGDFQFDSKLVPDKSESD